MCFSTRNFFLSSTFTQKSEAVDGVAKSQWCCLIEGTAPNQLSPLSQRNGRKNCSWKIPLFFEQLPILNKKHHRETCIVEANHLSWPFSIYSRYLQICIYIYDIHIYYIMYIYIEILYDIIWYYIRIESDEQKRIHGSKKKKKQLGERKIPPQLGLEPFLWKLLLFFPQENDQREGFQLGKWGYPKIDGFC